MINLAFRAPGWTRYRRYILVMVKLFYIFLTIVYLIYTGLIHSSDKAIPIIIYI